MAKAPDTFSEAVWTSRPRSLLRRLRRSDRLILLVLVLLPLAVFALPALCGHAAIVGDNATQNYPLRELVAKLIRRGHLPLFDPYVWSGAPLLAGWNAGAAYPLTLLFVIFSGTVAWTLSLVVTWWVAAIGSYGFLRASRLAPVPSFLGAASFSFAGAMTAQISHIGLVEGMSWAPVALLAVLELSRCAGGGRVPDHVSRAARRSPLGWAVLLGSAGAMVVLAGEPRAITDVGVIVGVYGVWRGLRLGRRAGPYLLWMTGGLLLATALGAVQWLPGLAAVSTSQRATSSAAFFTSGSLPDRWLLLLFVPDVLGGSGSFGQPAFLAHYNLGEVTGYVGLMPLVAAVALLGRLRWRRPLPEWLVWHVVALIGILLALGGNTPLWHVLIRVPLFGGQRFQSRNIVIADMGFAFLLAYWSNSFLAGAQARAGSVSDPLVAGTRVPALWPGRRLGAIVGSGVQLGRAERSIGAFTGLVAVATVAVAIAWGAGLLRWLGVGIRSAALDGSLRLWFVPFGALGLLAAALIFWGHCLGPSRRKHALVAFVVTDIAVFSLLVIVSPLANLGRGPARPAGEAVSTTTVATDSGHGTADALSAASPTQSLPVSARTFVGTGRFAVYDPNGIDAEQLNVIDAPDMNVVDGIASVQGYGSIVDGSYASATGSHSAAGNQGDILDPRAVADGTLDEFDTTVLFAPRDYFAVSSKSDSAQGSVVAGDRRLSAGERATWYLGAELTVGSVVVPDRFATADSASGLRFGVLTSAGTILWAPTVTAAVGSLHVALGRSVPAVGLVAQAARRPMNLGPPSFTGSDGNYVADGQLQSAVLPPHWTFRGLDGEFAVFANNHATPALTLRGSAGGSVHAKAGPSFAPSEATVSSPHGVEVIRSEAAIPGWTATWNPDVGPTVTLRVRRVGLVQGVRVPRGSGVLTWSYDPPGWTSGLALSACALAVLLGLCWALAIRRSRFLVGAIARRRSLAAESFQ